MRDLGGVHFFILDSKSVDRQRCHLGDRAIDGRVPVDRTRALVALVQLRRSDRGDALGSVDVTGPGHLTKSVLHVEMASP